MTSIKVHFAKIIDLDPCPISCMSLNHQTKKLALFRGGERGVIELWDVKHQPVLETMLLALEKINGKPSVEGIVWAGGDRLFSCGLHGFILEHHIPSGKILNKAVATSGSVWCLAVNPSQTMIAAGTEDGFVNIFDIEDNSLTYSRVLDRQDGRVLCMQWSSCGRYIATGSVDSIRFWDVKKGHALQRLMTGRSKNKETIVWCILVLEDLTIVSGDSRGIVSFWDARVGVLRQKVHTHKADVLTLRLTTDKSTIYAAGVDPLIQSLTKVQNSGMWMKSHARNVHVADVLTLETFGNRLFSGGADTDLGFSSFPPKVISKYPDIPKTKDIASSTDSSLIMTKDSGTIVMWKLPDDKHKLTKILELKSKGNENIFSIAISPCGSFFAYSTSTAVAAFALNYSSEEVNEAPILDKILIKEDILAPKTNHLWHMRFISSTTLVLISSDCRRILLAKIEVQQEGKFLNILHDEELLEEEEESTSEAHMSIGCIAVSPSIICVSMDKRIVVYKITNSESIKRLHTLPTHSAPPTALAIHPEQPLVLVTYADHTVSICNFQAGKVVFQEKVSKKFDDQQPFQGASWSGDGTVALLYQNDNVYLMESSKEISPKRRKTSGSDIQQHFSIKSCSSGNKTKYIAFAGAYDKGNEFVVIEIDPGSILERLPPAFSKKRFGN